MMRTINGTVGCVKFPKSGIQEGKTAAGISYIANTATLVGLRVIVGNADIPAGSIAYVSGKEYTSPWAKTIYKLEVPDDKHASQPATEYELIFVPVSSIQVVA